MAAIVQRGIGLPFQVTRGAGDVAAVMGDDLRRARGELILGIQASGGAAVGELAWDPERGSRLELLRHAAASDGVGALALVYVEEAFRQIPGETVRGVDVTVDRETVDVAVELVPADDTSAAARPVRATTAIKR